MRRLEEAVAIFVGPGEGSLHVAEELGFQECFRKGSAIDGDKRIFGAGAVFMNGARNQFFAGAAFSGDQHAAVLRRDILDQVEDRAHLRAGADDVIESGEPAEFAPEITCFLLQGEAIDALLNRGAKFVDEPVAFDNVAVGAEIDGVDRRVDGGNARHQNKSGGGRHFLGIAQQFDSIHVGHANIGHHDVEHLRSEAALGGITAGSHFHFVALFAEADFEQFADGSLVVDN